MARFYLIRHAMNDFVGKKLAGRMPGVHLNEEGRAQARLLARKLAAAGIERVYSSPRERALETAEALSEAMGVKVETRPTLDEVESGDWTGKTFAELEADPRWQTYNRFRSGTRVPGGETMLETQGRVVTEILNLYEAHPSATIAILSHADPIRAALVYFLGMPIDFF
ncbi:MAG: histidine phosphatase family protein, partial [Acidobacteriia bacterium]|nr:histidine phosphatase family protein [Terriglobia bacterium]MBV8905730.1 histidine phosphatase family protein [Terriglobia bacterium]